jgi:hypothetical protein
MGRASTGPRQVGRGERQLAQSGYRPFTNITGVDANAQINRKISRKNRKINGKLGFRGFEPELGGAALLGFDKQLTFEQIKDVVVRGVAGHVKWPRGLCLSPASVMLANTVAARARRAFFGAEQAWS